MQFDHETLLGTFEGGSWYQANWQLNVLVNAGPNVALGLLLCARKAKKKLERLFDREKCPGIVQSIMSCGTTGLFT